MRKSLLIAFTSMSLAFSLFAGNPYRLLVGTYTNTGTSEGIYSYEADLEQGNVKLLSVAKSLENPSFLAISPDKQLIYSVSESPEASRAGAFAFDATTGTITFLNSSLTGGKGPCHIAMGTKHVITANYGGGNLSVFGIADAGRLTELTQLIQHTGNSIHPSRQLRPHAHQVVFTPDKQYLLSCNLGTDKVMVYLYDAGNKQQPLTAFDSIRVKAGSGPRHLTISNNGKIVYLLQELDGTVSVMSLKKGRLKLLQETSVVTKKDITVGAADIHLSPDGRFLYATNRGTANDISCFTVAKNGKLSFVEQVSSGGVGPRNFAISPDGKYLLAGNQRTDNIVVFRRDMKTGRLTNTGKEIKTGAPVCLLFY
jgi:6-phosphogluconolactonase